MFLFLCLYFSTPMDARSPPPSPPRTRLLASRINQPKPPANPTCLRRHQMEVKYKAPKGGKSLLAKVAAKSGSSSSGRRRGGGSSKAAGGVPSSSSSNSSPAVSTLQGNDGGAGGGGGVGGGREDGAAKVTPLSARTKALGKGRGGSRLEGGEKEGGSAFLLVRVGAVLGVLLHTFSSKAWHGLSSTSAYPSPPPRQLPLLMPRVPMLPPPYFCAFYSWLSFFRGVRLLVNPMFFFFVIIFFFCSLFFLCPYCNSQAKGAFQDKGQRKRGRLPLEQ